MCKLYIKAAAVLLAVMSVTAPALAGTYIKDLKVIGGTESEVNALKSSLGSQGWKVINKDLNAGAGGDYIYLLYLPESNDNGSNYGYVTDFYISNSKDAPDNITHEGRDYYRVFCDGGKDFVKSKGDLNSKAGGDYIYLYYTKDSFDDYRVVTDIVFNDTKSGAVGVNGGSAGYNLNNNADGKFIYMHFSTETLASRLVIVGKRQDTSHYYPLDSRPDLVGSSTFVWSQQLYKSSEIGNAGTITSIMFDYTSDEPCSFSEVEMYMVHTNWSFYSMFNSDRVQYYTSDKVYEGILSAPGPGWLTVTLDNAFEYDGKSNLMLHCLGNADTVGDRMFGMFIGHVSDAVSVYNYGSSRMKNNLQLTMIPDYYPKPEASISSVNDNGAKISWPGISSATGYAYQYRRVGKTTWSKEKTTSGTSVTLDDLYAADLYDFRVRARYGNSFSTYSMLSFMTTLTGTAATVRGETQYVSSFYNTSHNFKLPDDALAYTVAPDGDRMVFYQLGSIIPAGTAVIIISDKTESDTGDTKTIQISPTDNSAALSYPNILQGSDTPVDVSGGKVDGKTVYVFGIDKGKLGFYQFSGSQVPPGKAYYLAR